MLRRTPSARVTRGEKPSSYLARLMSKATSATSTVQHRCGQRCAVTQMARADLHVGVHELAHPVAPLDKDAYLLTMLQEQVRQMAAEQSRRAGHQYCHSWTPLQPTPL